MKKTGFKLFAVSLALCFFFGACNFNINGGKELAEVRVGGGGGRAANPETGLPIFDGSNTTITISDASGRLIAEGPLPLSAEVVVGVEIVVKATVRTASGTWSRTKTHTVKAGINDIDLELSKTPNVVGNFFFDVVETISANEVKLRLKFRNGKTFPDTIRMGGNYHKPVTARDSLGRLYLLYHGDSEKKFTRFDVDGNEDTGFKTAVSSELNALLPPVPQISDIDNIAVDGKNNKIFLIIGDKAHCFIENRHNNFVHLDGFLTGISASDTVQSAAAYDGKLFVKFVSGTDEKLFAYDYTISHTALTLYKKPRVPSSSDFKIGSTALDCMGLFADEDGVYCLLSKKNDAQNSDPLYAVGKLIRYSHDLDGKVDFDDNPSIDTPFQSLVSHNNSIAFDARYFSYPVGFIGSDEENIYIADDGVGIANGKEGWRVTGEKNRIAAFNRKTGTLTFTDTDATWYAYHAAYPSKKTPALLWEKVGFNNMKYWVSASGTDSCPTRPLLEVSYSPTLEPTDVFCYDQDGNLYILLWDVTNTRYNVRRFILGVNGYVKDDDVYLSGVTQHALLAIAVDVSDGINTVYCGIQPFSGNWDIKKAVWTGNFSGTHTPANFVSSGSGKLTALAANRDGVFVATKEQTALTDPYTLKVAKYKKGSSPVQDGVITVVSASPAENPSPHPPAGDYERYEEAVRDLQVIDGVLYGISSKTTESRKYVPVHHETDVFKNSSKLYKIGSTKDAFSGNAVELAKKDPVDTAGNEVGYGFYRFIAVKYDEAERIRLIIASDGAWGTGGTAEPHGDPKNTDKVLEYDLAGNLLVERNSGGSFSQKLTHIVGTGFSWE
ncbi:hypothetical protein H0R94_06225 [Treponema socranskii]|uniref:hypothetical protein n=1 Tax=Treponema socranskii TaxID=53419 RepID=UPI003D8B734E